MEHKEKSIGAATSDRVAWGIEEWAARYGVSRSRAYGEIAAGRLKTSKIGARRIVTAAQDAAYRKLIGG